MREIVVTYDPSDHARFRSGILWKQWARQYPQAFDKADIRLVQPRAPHGRLFGEWLAATHYATHGYRVLIGKYQFAKAHPAKNAAFRRVAPMAVVKLLTPGGRYGRRQGPDLFVYSEDHRWWFFAEIKGPGDTISPRQRELFAEIERCSGGRDVVIVRTTPRIRLSSHRRTAGLSSPAPPAAQPGRWTDLTRGRHG